MIDEVKHILKSAGIPDRPLVQFALPLLLPPSRPVKVRQKQFTNFNRVSRSVLRLRQSTRNPLPCTRLSPARTTTGSLCPTTWLSTENVPTPDTTFSK